MSGYTDIPGGALVLPGSLPTKVPPPIDNDHGGSGSVDVVAPTANALMGQAADARSTYRELEKKANRDEIDTKFSEVTGELTQRARAAEASATSAAASAEAAESRATEATEESQNASSLAEGAAQKAEEALTKINVIEEAAIAAEVAAKGAKESADSAVAAANSVTGSVDEALRVANAAKTQADENEATLVEIGQSVTDAVNQAAEAHETADDAKSVATSAVNTANEAKATAASAATAAASAETTASAANTKVDSVIANVQTATSKADAAQQTAMSALGKATTAESKATTLTTTVENLTTGVTDGLNMKLDKTSVVDPSADSIKGQAADARAVYNALQNLPSGGSSVSVVAPNASAKTGEAADARATYLALQNIPSGGGSSIQVVTPDEAATTGQAADARQTYLKLEALEASIPTGGGGSGATMISKTWAQLQTLVKTKALTPGALYRLTNYKAVVWQTSTYFHPFDIVVVATSSSTLSEEARAVPHVFTDEDIETYGEDEQKYFANSDLSAWRLWYSLDNDTSRFSWADASGTGVIYRMIDEWNNDIPFDFKNLRITSLVGNGVFPTFTGHNDDGGVFDATVVYTDRTKVPHDNKVAPYYDANGVQTPTDIWFEGACSNNSFGPQCRHIELLDGVGNTFGTYCFDNRLGSCKFNTFGNDCARNTLNHCTSNTFGSSCYENTFDYVIRSSFGNGVSRNYFSQRLRGFTVHNDVADVSISRIGDDDGTYIRNVEIMPGVRGHEISIDPTTTNESSLRVYKPTDVQEHFTDGTPHLRGGLEINDYPNGYGPHLVFDSLECGDTDTRTRYKVPLKALVEALRDRLDLEIETETIS